MEKKLFFHLTVFRFYFPNTVAWKNGKSPLKVGEAIFLLYSIQILFSKYCSVEKWKIATVGGAIFLPHSIRILFSMEKWKIAT